MHRARRVGRHEFDIHPLVLADGRIAVSGAGLEDRAQLRVPHRRVEADVEEPRLYRMDRKAAAAIIAGRELAALQRRGDLFGEHHRVLLHLPRQDHRRIGREIAMRRVARRLDRDPRDIEPGRQRALGDEVVERGQENPAKIAENVSHRCGHSSPRYRPTGGARRGQIGRSCRRGNPRPPARARPRRRRSARATPPANGRARQETGETAR